LNQSTLLGLCKFKELKFFKHIIFKHKGISITIILEQYFQSVYEELQ